MTEKENKIKITDLQPAKYNPRKITEKEYKKLTQSINEYGLIDPIIINLKNNHIIGGHQRYEVLLDKYLQTNEEKYKNLTIIKRGDIGWVFPEETLKVKDLNHEKGMNISLNKITADWDIEKLQDLFNDLSIEGFTLDNTGFDKEEINLVFDNVELPKLENTLTTKKEEEPEEKTKEKTREQIIHRCPECGYEWGDTDE